MGSHGGGAFSGKDPSKADRAEELTDALAPLVKDAIRVRLAGVMAAGATLATMMVMHAGFSATLLFGERDSTWWRSWPYWPARERK